MSRTYKDEHKTDGWNTGRRLARRARPAGRMLQVLAVEDAAHGSDEELDDFLALQSYEDEMAEFLARDDVDPWDVECGCYCRRCLLHGDCGGCTEPGGHPS